MLRHHREHPQGQRRVLRVVLAVNLDMLGDASDVIRAVGIIVLAANIYCLVLLTRHRADDLNMSSAWRCSRNDVIANIGILGAAGAVAFTDSAWPDIVIGLGIAVLFGSSAATVLRDARQARSQSATWRSP